jgi:hypothetical protein
MRDEDYFMTWPDRFASWRWDVRYFFRCHTAWFTKTDRIGRRVTGSVFHHCKRARWHWGPCIDAFGQLRPREESNL